MNRGSLKIVSLFGIEIRIHISLILLLLYFIFVLSAGFPVAVKSAGVDLNQIAHGPYLWSIILSFSLLVSIVLHELGHALVAQHYGVKVRAITLMMLGGVSSMERPPETPYLELKLAVAGPIVSFLIAGVMALLQAFSHAPELLFYSHWLGSTNLILGIFNLLPAFPLDGGRAFRSYLAARHGIIRATRTVVQFSKSFSFVLGILALISFNILLLLIAFFIYSASQSEHFFLVSQGLLQGVKVREFACIVPSVSESQPISDVTSVMLSSRHTLLPVETIAHSPALISLSKIMNIPKKVWNKTCVNELMEKVNTFGDSEMTISQIMPELLSSPYGPLPYLEQGRIKGLIRFSDLTEVLELRSLEEGLPESLAFVTPQSTRKSA